MEANARKRWIAAGISLALLGSVVWMFLLRTPSSLSTYVPDHAAWYAETRSPEKILRSLENEIRPYSDSGLGLLQNLRSDLAFVRRVFAGQDEFYASLSEKPFGISAHAVSGTETGYVFYLAATGEEQKKIMILLESRFRSGGGFRFENREYLGEAVAEISKKNGKTLSIACLKNALVASFSGFLVEEVIRNSGVMIKPGFALEISRDPRYRHMESMPVRIFINNSQFPAWIREFFPNQEPGLFSLGGRASVLGLQTGSGSELELQGFSLSRTESVPSGRVLSSSLPQFLPEGMEVMSWQLGGKNIWTALTAGKKEDEARLALLQSALEDEMAAVLAQGQGLRKYDHLLVAGIKDAAALEQVMQSLAGGQSPSFLYSEDYRGVRLLRHRQNGLASEIGGRFFAGWSASFYAMANGHLLISDQIDLLRQCVDEGLKKKEAEAENHPAGTFRLRASMHALIPCLSENATPAFRRVFRDWLPLLKAVKKVEFSDLGDGEDPGIALKMLLKKPEAGQDSLRILARTFLDSGVVAGPVGFGTSESKEPRWLVQDMKKQVHFLTQNLQPGPVFPAEAYWISDPCMIRRDHAGKFSVLLSLPSRTLAFSSDGEPEPDFPFLLNDSLVALSHTALMDYDHSLQYRLFASSRYGNLFAADAAGRLLPGWNPSPIRAVLAMPPRHIRVAGRDYILMLDKKGNLFLTNRKGEMQPGFPFRLKGDSYAGIFSEPGLEEETSFVYCLSELGQMEKVSLRGKQVSFLQLFRPEVNTRFLLCPDQKERTFVVARCSPGAVTLFDQSYRPVLDYRSTGSRFLVRHFQFGGAGKVYAITDLDAKTCQLFNESGLPVLRKPFSCSGPADVYRPAGLDERLRVFFPFENRVSIGEFYAD